LLGVVGHDNRLDAWVPLQLPSGGRASAHCCRFDPGDEHVRAMLLDQRYRLVGVGSPTDDLDADPYKKTVQRIQPKWMPVKDDCGLLGSTPSSNVPTFRSDYRFWPTHWAGLWPL